MCVWNGSSLLVDYEAGRLCLTVLTEAFPIFVSMVRLLPWSAVITYDDNN